jgi:hypothetical protein
MDVDKLIQELNAEIERIKKRGPDRYSSAAYVEPRE